MMTHHSGTALNTKNKRGFVLFLSVLVVSIAVAIALSMSNLTIRALQLSGSSRESVHSIYAADTGAECALLWDIRGTDIYGGYVFPRSSSSSIPPSGSNLDCLGTDISTVWTTATGGSWGRTTFTLSVGNGCTIVEVYKESIGGGLVRTSIFSRGYNTPCGTINGSTVERAFRVSYE